MNVLKLRLRISFPLVVTTSVFLSTFAPGLVSTCSGQVDQDDLPAAYNSFIVDDYATCLAWGDLDQDGDLDLVTGGSDAVKMRINNSGTLESDPAWISLRDDTTNAIAVGDIDNDGDLDFVIGTTGINAVYLNDGTGSFTETPWGFDLTENTASIALGDIDEDDDLDVVCGNLSGINTVYTNETSNFLIREDWALPADIDDTRSIALGDLDNNGYLDVVCGNDQASNSVHFNDGSGFDPAPTLFGANDSRTRSISLGDLDNDGDLDCACGEYGQNVAFRNIGTGFDPEPLWSPESELFTESIDLGDMDGDGDLDIVCGNGPGDTAERYDRIYYAANGTIEISPINSWQSNDNDATSNLAVVDVNGDSSLDLIRIMDNSITININQSALITSTQVWETGENNNTKAIALADLDGDSDLDLVCANSGHHNTIYYNDSGNLSEDPWSTAEALSSHCLAWGDMDGDGDIDLAFGNTGYNTLYLNESGEYAQAPYWTSVDTRPTQDMLFCDMDRDNDLDLLCANYDSYDDVEQPNTFYENVDGQLDNTPQLLSGYDGSSLALIDTDRDGYQDLVVGVNGGRSQLYRNQLGQFSSDPVWREWQATNTTDITCGDINGDGKDDLVLGNFDQLNQLYYAQDETFESASRWSSDFSRQTQQLALADIDGNGRLDLICTDKTNPNGDRFRSHIHLNTDGELNSSLDLEFQVTYWPLSHTAGDYDDDGDPDVIVGTLAFNIIFDNLLNNPIPPGGLDSRHGLPNNGARIGNLVVTNPGTNIYRIDFQAYDVESDPFYLVAEYQYRGEPVWREIEPEAGQLPLGPFASSPDGEEATFTWNIDHVEDRFREIVLRLKVIESSLRVGKFQRSFSFRRDMGRLNIRRPDLAVSDQSISFPGVTVGDTTRAPITIFNPGSEELTVTDFDFPTTKMSENPPAPWSVPPGEFIDVELLFFPVETSEIGNSISINSNDPLNPQTTILIADYAIHPLSGQTQVHTDEEQVPAGVPVSVQFVPDEGVHVEQANLRLAWGNDPVEFETIAMPQFGSIFVGVIPDTAVTEIGTHYYIELMNSGLMATDPPNAPGDSLYTLPVAVPEALDIYAQPNSGQGYLRGSSVQVQALLNEGIVFETGTLFYRQGGQTEFQEADFSAGTVFPYATIPAEDVGSRGIEYYVEIETQTTTLTDPIVDPANNPSRMSVRVLDQSESAMTPASAYRMLSIPLVFEADLQVGLPDILSDQGEFGPYDKTRWRTFRYDSLTEAYIEYSVQQQDTFLLQPGRAFWLISRQQHRVDTAPMPGQSTPLDAPFEIILQPGHNQIGNPFAFPVAWSDVTVDGVPVLDSDTVGLPVGYADRELVIDVTVLEPFAGYWVENTSEPPIEVALSVPPVETVSTKTSRGAVDWQLEITATCEDVRSKGRAAVSENAAAAWDHADRSLPPPSPGRWLSVHFPHGEWDSHAGIYFVDVRNPSNDGQAWAFDVAKGFVADGADDEVTLQFSGLASVPADWTLVLLDLDLGQRVDLRSTPEYRYHCGWRERLLHHDATRFQLLAGTDQFIAQRVSELPDPPSRTVLLPNRPNPFNPATNMRYEIAEAGRVTLHIYDLAGSLVKTLVNRHHEPGRFNVVWQGRNDSGQRVAAGVYFARLTAAGGRNHTRKMTLLK